MSPERSRFPRWLIPVCLVLIAAGILVGVLVPAGAGWDFANFYDTGARALHGQIGDIYNPASLIAGHAPQGKMAFWGAPISAYLYVPLAVFSAPVAMVVLKSLGSLAFGLGLVLLYRHSREVWERTGPGGGFLGLFLVLVLLYQPFWTMFRVGGQTTPFAFLLTVLALGAYRRDRMVRAALLLVFAVLFKPAFLFVPAILALCSGRRFFLAAAAAGGALALSSVLLLGWPVHHEFLTVAAAGASKPSPWYFNSSLTILADVAARALGGSRTGPQANLVRTGIKLAVLALGALLVWRGRRAVAPGATRRHLTFLLAVSVTLLVSQVVWEHYLTLLFIPLVYLAAAAPAMTAGARRLLAAVFVLSLGQNLVLVMALRDHVPADGPGMLLALSLFKCGPLLLYLLWLLWYHREAFDIFSEHPVPVAAPAELAHAPA